MSEIPQRYRKFTEDYPEVAKSYEKLGSAVHSHTRKALEANCSPLEIHHTVMLSLPTIGLPSMMAALSWVDDIIDKEK